LLLRCHNRVCVVRPSWQFWSNFSTWLHTI
jgi:hypothetical protein